MTDCLAATGASDAWIVVSAIAAGAVALGITLALLVRRRSRLAPAALLGVLVLSLTTGGMATSPAAHAADEGCATAAPTATASPTPTATATAPAPVTIAGSWEGAINPPGGYNLLVTITDDGTVASGVLSYPELLCEAEWTQTARSETTVTFSETLTVPGGCADDGTVVLTLLDSPLTQLGYIYTYSGGITAIDQGTLTRTT
ncbi:hypothetical protein [Protaetiibacter intestinalis]|uniref:Uncharacterized protein n=1 Tax=Protaetiibacter intestinalis TaxID=2419774 RepID=A0A387B7H1_9MICO|nr:hypothetical protein [Protaetiibacter intestinalis]AYF97698.1 hypothetical protein D7I47_05140 [Protaetiibacter intestinalis]